LFKTSSPIPEKFNFNPDIISPGNRATAISSDTYLEGFHEIRVISPTNAVGGTVECFK
jgi:hypothetical protein